MSQPTNVEPAPTAGTPKSSTAPARTRRERITLADHLEISSNGIGFLRLVLAVLVLVSHSWRLGGFGREPLDGFGRNHWTLGTVSVVGFFALSGFLLTHSWRRKPRAPQYMLNRGLRILPAFWVCLIVSAFLIGPLSYLVQGRSLSHYPFLVHVPGRAPLYTYDYAGPFSAVGYVMENFFLNYKQWTIGGVFHGVPESPRGDGTIDFSVWTLYWEALCYIGLLALGMVGLLKSRRPLVVPMLAVASLIGLGVAVHEKWSVRLPALTNLGSAQLLWIASFTVGMGVACLADRIVVSHIAGALCGVVFMVMLWFGWLEYGAIVPFTYFVLWLGFTLPIRDLEHRFDLSYGIYLYAFPLQQLAATMKWQRYGIVAFTLGSLLLTLPIAAVSWFLIERPALGLKQSPTWRFGT